MLGYLCRAADETSYARRHDIPTCKEEEELHLCQCLAQTLPLPNGEWNEVVVFFHLACSIQEALWAKLCAINPVVTLCSTVYFFCLQCRIKRFRIFFLQKLL